MIENGMLIGNRQDSSARDFIELCCGCEGEIYFGESCLDFGGNYLHAETAHFVEVDELSGSERGVDGFGSTGVK
ncbi:hypothetical protein [Bacillus sp. FDAARGOS_1420]|uniref:hypothetical protein n=1 Tax=unclassified Bacillus (in: firmicutes) TaxID=185979 RepID=UPI00214CEE1B|nr:hypothetical protein [Bacillus sp. FDAARGOS_1420]